MSLKNKDNKWLAQIRIDGKKTYVGCFYDEERQRVRTARRLRDWAGR